MEEGDATREQMDGALKEERTEFMFHGPHADDYNAGAMLAGVPVDKFKKALRIVLKEATAGSWVGCGELINMLLVKLGLDADEDKRSKDAMKTWERAFVCASLKMVPNYKDRDGNVWRYEGEGVKLQPRRNSEDDDDCEGQYFSDWSPWVGEDEECGNEDAAMEETAKEEAAQEEAAMEEAVMEETAQEEAAQEEAAMEETAQEEAAKEEAVDGGAEEAAQEDAAKEEAVDGGAEEAAQEEAAKEEAVDGGAEEAAMEDRTDGKCAYTSLQKMWATGEAMSSLARIERRSAPASAADINGDFLGMWPGVNDELTEVMNLEKQMLDLTIGLGLKAATMKPVIQDIESGMKGNIGRLREQKQMSDDLASTAKELEGKKKESRDRTNELASFRDGRMQALAAWHSTMPFDEIESVLQQCKVRFPEEQHLNLNARMEEGRSEVEKVEGVWKETQEKYDAFQEQSKKDVASFEMKQDTYKAMKEEHIRIHREFYTKWKEMDERRRAVMEEAFRFLDHFE